jgi:hypothetical protein
MITSRVVPALLLAPFGRVANHSEPSQSGLCRHPDTLAASASATLGELTDRLGHDSERAAMITSGLAARFAGPTITDLRMQYRVELFLR